jgi:two-component system aerobic respiration control sensor histidine kinase ArcB
MVRDRDLKTVGLNPFMEKLTGKSATELIGMRPWEVFPFLQDAGVKKHLQQVLKEETRQMMDFHFYAPETARSVWMSYTSSPLRDARGEITGVVSIINDITERKRVGCVTGK